jgi:hypothetical protein
MAASVVALHDLPLIAEIERMMDIRGVEWRKDFEDKVEHASLALFGITKSDTLPPEPHPDHFGNSRSRYVFSDKDFSDYDAALSAWYDWHRQWEFFVPIGIADEGITLHWPSLGFDIDGIGGQPLRCLPYFERQMFAVANKLLPNAKFTPDGSGRALQHAEAWGVSLEAQAKAFKSRRNR